MIIIHLCLAHLANDFIHRRLKLRQDTICGLIILFKEPTAVAWELNSKPALTTEPPFPYGTY